MLHMRWTVIILLEEKSLCISQGHSSATGAQNHVLQSTPPNCAHKDHQSCSHQPRPNDAAASPMPNESEQPRINKIHRKSLLKQSRIRSHRHIFTVKSFCIAILQLST